LINIIITEICKKAKRRRQKMTIEFLMDSFKKAWDKKEGLK
jgi:hypothetical protein